MLSVEGRLKCLELINKIEHESEVTYQTWQTIQHPFVAIYPQPPNTNNKCKTFQQQNKPKFTGRKTVLLSTRVEGPSAVHAEQSLNWTTA